MKKTQKETNKVVEQEVYKCKFCDSEYGLKEHFNVHERDCMELRLKEAELKIKEAELKTKEVELIYKEKINKLVEQGVYKCKICGSEYRLKERFEIHERDCIDLILMSNYENEAWIRHLNLRLEETKLITKEAEIRANVAEHILSEENNFLKELLVGKHAKFDVKELNEEMKRIRLECIEHMKELKQLDKTIDLKKKSKSSKKLITEENRCMMKLLYTNSTEENISMMKMIYPKHTETDEQNE